MKKGTGLGFEEGMYGILYQVVHSTDQLASRGVPIHCVYTTESSTVKPAQLLERWPTGGYGFIELPKPQGSD